MIEAIENIVNGRCKKGVRYMKPGKKFITVGDGSGGLLMQSLLKEHILPHLEVKEEELTLLDMDDSGTIGDIAFTTDAYTVKPIFFPGGDIGSLSISGTVNDLSAVGSKPIAISSALILEEGLEISSLEKIIESMQKTARSADVYIIAGDTKVIERGALEKCIVCTSGIGKRSRFLDGNIEEVRNHREFSGRWIKDSNLGDGDVILINGSIGDHGISIMSKREGIEFESEIKSDTKPLNHLVERILKIGGVTCLKDPTRGGVSNALNEWSEKSHIGIVVDEEKLPIKREVSVACELLGIDPLQIGNEGKMVIACVRERSEEILEELKRAEGEATIIGHATKDIEGVVLNTIVGGKRILETPIGDPIPRIC